MSKKQSETKKRYQREIRRIRKEIREQQNWLKSDATNKTDLLADYHRDVVKHEIVRLEQELAEAKKILKRYAKD